MRVTQTIAPILTSKPLILPRTKPARQAAAVAQPHCDLLPLPIGCCRTLYSPCLFPCHAARSPSLVCVSASFRSRQLTDCKLRCRRAKVEGSRSAFEFVLGWLASQRSDQVPVTHLFDVCHRHLRKQQRKPAGGAEADSASVFLGMPRDGPASSESSRQGRAAAEGDPSWEEVDAMYTDPEFRAGCLVFTQFYRRTYLRSLPWLQRCVQTA